MNIEEKFFAKGAKEKYQQHVFNHRQGKRLSNANPHHWRVAAGARAAAKLKRLQFDGQVLILPRDADIFEKRRGRKSRTWEELRKEAPPNTSGRNAR